MPSLFLSWRVDILYPLSFHFPLTRRAWRKFDGVLYSLFARIHHQDVDVGVLGVVLLVSFSMVYLLCQCSRSSTTAKKNWIQQKFIVDQISHLHEDLILEILSFLSPSSLVSLRWTCNWWNSFSEFKEHENIIYRNAAIHHTVYFWVGNRNGCSVRVRLNVLGDASIKIVSLVNCTFGARR